MPREARFGRAAVVSRVGSPPRVRAAVRPASLRRLSHRRRSRSDPALRRGSRGAPARVRTRAFGRHARRRLCPRIRRARAAGRDPARPLRILRRREPEGPLRHRPAGPAPTASRSPARLRRGLGGLRRRGVRGAQDELFARSRVGAPYAVNILGEDASRVLPGVLGALLPLFVAAGVHRIAARFVAEGRAAVLDRALLASALLAGGVALLQKTGALPLLRAQRWAEWHRAQSTFTDPSAAGEERAREE